MLQEFMVVPIELIFRPSNSKYNGLFTKSYAILHHGVNALFFILFFLERVLTYDVRS